MNSFNLHIGDYDKDAGHLSMLQDGAYFRLLKKYYGSEKPLPDSEVETLARAISDEEKCAVRKVLSDFFKKKSDGFWYSKRCTFEIRDFRRRVRINKINGLRGGRPKRGNKPNANLNETDSVPTKADSRKPHHPPDHHPPIPTHHTPVPTPQPPEAQPDGGEVDVGSGHGRAGAEALPTVEAVREFFAAIPAEDMRAFPWVAVARALKFIGVNPNTVARANRREDLKPDAFLRHYADILGDAALTKKLGALVHRLELTGPRRPRRGGTP